MQERRYKMNANPAANIEKYFAKLEDPRVERTKVHKLLDIVVIAICAVISSANEWEAVAEWGNDQHDWLKSFLELPSGIPSHDTFWRVFGALNPEQFQSCFVEWNQCGECVDPGTGGGH
jgi:hypothetical protein